jgi:hypothetical protein
MSPGPRSRPSWNRGSPRSSGRSPSCGGSPMRYCTSIAKI